MPTYDYRCKACGHEFELFQSMTEPVKRKCPACAKNTLERLIGTGAALVFKGSGFYQTDYRSESYKKAADADKAPAPADKPKADAATETSSKTDAKAAAKPEPAAAPPPASKPASEPKPTPAKRAAPRARR